MKVFRIKCVVNAFTLFTGIVFLNMSFVLVEIATLRIDRDNQMAQNLSMLVANSMAEEEPGASADEDSTLSEVDLIFSQHGSPGTIDSSSRIKFNIWSHGHPRLSEFEICNPPPEA